MKKALIFIVGILLLIGCASNTRQIVAEKSQTHTEGHFTETPLPSLTVTPIPRNTLTMTVKSNTPTTTPTPSPTWDGVSMRWVSPNGQYIAVKYEYGHGEIIKPVLEILDREGNLLHQIVYNKRWPQGEPQMSLQVYGWSADSKTLYYDYVYGPDGTDLVFWWTGYDLRSLNVENGYDQAVLPGEGAMSFAFSPDESKIIYSLESDPTSVIHLLDFESGKNTKIYVDPAPQEFKRIGDFQWSSDGKGIVFQTEEEWLEFEGGGVYMEVQTVYVDAQTLAQKLIHRGAMYDYQLEGWEDEQTLRFRTYDKGHILVDIHTGEERPALTGTHTPTLTNSEKLTKTITPTITLTPTVTPPLPTYSAYPDTLQQGPCFRKWSPDGKFLVEIYDYYGHGDVLGPVIEIFDQNNNMLWKIPYDGDTSGVEPYVSMCFLKWSVDGRELYFYTRYYGGSGGDYVFRANGSELSKIDLYTGEIHPLFPEGYGTAAFSVTKDGGRMVYAFFGENVDTVYIHNFWTGQTSSVLLDPGTQPFAKIGDFHWSPDEKGIVFQTEAEWLEFDGGGVYMEVETIYVNTISMEQKLIHRDAMYEYMLEDWIDNRMIRIHQRNEATHQYEVYVVDVFTGEETLLPDLEPEW